MWCALLLLVPTLWVLITALQYGSEDCNYESTLSTVDLVLRSFIISLRITLIFITLRRHEEWLLKYCKHICICFDVTYVYVSVEF